MIIHNPNDIREGYKVIYILSAYDNTHFSTQGIVTKTEGSRIWIRWNHSAETDCRLYSMDGSNRYFGDMTFFTDDRDLLQIWLKR